MPSPAKHRALRFRHTHGNLRSPNHAALSQGRFLAPPRAALRWSWVGESRTKPHPLAQPKVTGIGSEESVGWKNRGRHGLIRPQVVPNFVKKVFAGALFERRRDRLPDGAGTENSNPQHGGAAVQTNSSMRSMARLAFWAISRGTRTCGVKVSSEARTLSSVIVFIKAQTASGLTA